MASVEVNKRISKVTKHADALSDILAGETAFPLAMLIDQVIFAIKAVVAEDEDAADIVADLSEFAAQQVARASKRLAGGGYVDD